MSKTTVDAEKLGACLSLLRRIPNLNMDQGIVGICKFHGVLNDNSAKLLPSAMADVMTRVDPDLIICKDTDVNKDFLGSNYNYFAGGYRSPHTAEYFPSISEEPPTYALNIQAMEVECNTLLENYKNEVYRGGLSSAYVWDLAGDNDNSGGIGIAFHIRKEITASADGTRGGVWQTTHVVEAKETGFASGRSRTYTYRMVSSCAFLLRGLETREVRELWNGPEDGPLLTGRVAKVVESQATSSAPLPAVDPRSGRLVSSGYGVSPLGHVMKMLEANDLALAGWVSAQGVVKLKEVMAGLRISDDQLRAKVHKPQGIVTRALPTGTGKARGSVSMGGATGGRVRMAGGGDSEDEDGGAVKFKETPSVMQPGMHEPPKGRRGVNFAQMQRDMAEDEGSEDASSSSSSSNSDGDYDDAKSE